MSESSSFERADGPDDSRDTSGVEVAQRVAASGAEQASAIKETALASAGEVKDVAVERTAEVAGVAKDELSRLAGEARTQVQGLWSQASDQLREQAGNGKQQLADLLHSLAAELGQMASKSDDNGPLTALAKQAAARGGELSHWLQESEPADVLAEIKRFARRRPVVFLAGAAIAGVVVGRLSRSLMASDDGQSAARPGAARASSYSDLSSSAGVRAVPVTTRVTEPAPLTDEPEFGAGEELIDPTSNRDDPWPVQPRMGGTPGGVLR